VAVVGVAVADGAETSPSTPALPTAQEIFKMKLQRLHSVAVSRSALAIGAALALSLGGTFASAADAPQTSPTTANAAKAKSPSKAKAPKLAVFASPQEGFEALVAALRQHDFKALTPLFGPGHERISNSGDSAADLEAADRFVADYGVKHTIQQEGDAKAFLTIGDTDWAMPIPMVKVAGGWSFDADEGEAEVLARRVGRNELDAMQVCLAFIDMQREYAEVDRNGDGTLEYAARLVSTAGKHDGLYWEAKAGEPQSPAGPRLAEADPQPRKAGSAPTPFHGYYYRILTKQGSSAPGGARDYFVRGKLIGGVALLAWPATYMNSGVKTFMCGLDGTVLEKDLGANTAATASKIKAYDPDKGWAPAK